MNLSRLNLTRPGEASQPRPLASDERGVSGAGQSASSHGKPVLFDFYCKAGGCTKGYQRAGFFVVGIDIEAQPNYCGDAFVQMDALEALRVLLDGGTIAGFGLEDIAAFHASPPCQAHSTLNSMWNARADHPDLIPPTRELLRATGLPYAIENVEGAPLENAVRICGSSIGLPLIRRHRLFETNFPLMVPPCAHGVAERRFPALDAEGRRKGQKSGIVGVYGHGGDKRADLWPVAMGIAWMTRAELTQAIPPAYCEHIGGYLLDHIRQEEKAA